MPPSRACTHALSGSGQLLFTAMRGGLTGVFSDKAKKVEDNEAEVKDLHAKIGKLALLGV